MMCTRDFILEALDKNLQIFVKKQEKEKLSIEWWFIFNYNACKWHYMWCVVDINDSINYVWMMHRYYLSFN